MKKLVFGLIATVVFGFAGNAFCVEKKENRKSNELIKQPISTLDGSISTTWTIGRKSKNCHRFGICKLEKVTITIAEGDVPNSDGDFYGKVSNNGKKQIELVVDSNNIERIKKAFGGESLILEEDFTIDDVDLLKQLGLDKYTLKSGTYNFEYDKVTSKYRLVL